MQYITNKCGGQKLCFEGFVFDKHETYSEKVVWRCEKRSICKARLHIAGGQVLKRHLEHTHGPDHHPADGSFTNRRRHQGTG